MDKSLHLLTDSISIYNVPVDKKLCIVVLAPLLYPKTVSLRISAPSGQYSTYIHSVISFSNWLCWQLECDVCPCLAPTLIYYYD